MARKIIHKESASIGKCQGQNDDAIYVGEDYAAVIDGVSHKSSIIIDGKEVKIAQIITQAIRKIDGTSFAEVLNFNEFVKYVNNYIAKYLKEIGKEEEIGKMEATGVIYSKQFNQIWIVGDCIATYDNHVVKNPLKIDEVVIDLRVQLVKALLQEGYSQEELEDNDISKEIIKSPKLLSKYISSKRTQAKLESYRKRRIKQALLECGFSKQEIAKGDLVKKYYNPRDLQKFLKNNPNAGDYGYAIFNGVYTEQKNCKVEQLPYHVKKIKLFSDGFSIDSLSNDRDLGEAIQKMWEKSANDPLGIAENRATRPSQTYSNKEKDERAVDDRSAIIIEIVNENDLGENDSSERG